MTILVVVQARMGSSRLPGKVLLPLAGRPLLQRLLERVMGASTFFDLVVATTTQAEDDPIRDLCRGMGVRCFDGHPVDLLDRHYQAARAGHADAVVKIPSDCPLIDPAIIDRVLRYFLAHQATVDFVSNLRPPSYPDGNDVEVIPFPVLETAWAEATGPLEREHTTPYIWRQPERFRLGNVAWETGWDLSASHRWTIDYPEDYAFLSRVYDQLWSSSGAAFSIRDILALLHAQPQIAALNARHVGTSWERLHADELRMALRTRKREPA
jgi:spore coat polysaccharide biosynthesis protein SpsF